MLAGSPICLGGLSLVGLSFEDANELVDMLNRQDREIDRTARQLVSTTTYGVPKAARPQWSREELLAMDGGPQLLKLSRLSRPRRETLAPSSRNDPATIPWQRTTFKLGWAGRLRLTAYSQLRLSENTPCPSSSSL